MAPKGYISLGPYNDIRPVIAKDLRQVPMDTANPFAAPGGGNKGYNDLEGWAEFTMNDWQAGAGEHDPESGGYLYGLIEGRVPGQLILPQALWPQSAWNGAAPGDYDFYDFAAIGDPRTGSNVYKVGPSETIKKVAIRQQSGTPSSGLTTSNRLGATVYILCAQEPGAARTTIRVSIYTGVVSPTTEVAWGTATIYDDSPFPRWVKCTITSGSGVNTSNDWIVLTPANSISVYKYTTMPANHGFASSVFTSSWSTAITTEMPTIIGSLSMIQDTGYSAAYARVGPFVSRGDYQYAYCGDKVLKWQPPTISTWSVADDVGTLLVGQMAVFDNVIYFCRGSGNAYTLSAADAHGNLAYPAQSFYSDGSYLWKVNGTTISYSADATTWTDVPNVTTAAFPVQAMASMAGTLYYITREGVFYIAPGDYCRKLFLFSDKNPLMPCRMVEFQGNLFIMGGNLLYRVDAGGSILPLPLPGDDANLAEETRYLRSMAAGQNWIYIGTSNSSETRGVVWSWSPDGWHTVCFFPGSPYHLHVDRFEQCVWIGDVGRTWRFRALDVVRNPFFDTNNHYNPFGWVETDKFYGTNKVLLKDMESIFIDGEASNSYVEVYYKSDATAAWQILGQATGSPSMIRELRWEHYPDRLGVRWMKLGFLFVTYALSKTPRVIALSLKYTPMVNDRFRWRVDLSVPPRLSDVDGELYTGTYDQASMIAHITACVKSVVPIIFYDVDGTHYEVKVVAASRSIERVEPKRGGTKDVSYVWSLTLEQVNATPTVAY